MPAIGHYCVIYSKQPQIPLVVDGDIHDHATDQRPDENGSPLSADEPGKTNVMSDQKQMGKGRAAAIRAGMGPWFRRAETHGPLIAGLLVLSSGAPTVAADEVPPGLKGGLMGHEVHV